MKKAILISAFIFLAGLNGLVAQHSRIVPIPCFNYHLTSKNTVFQERLFPGTTPKSDEKRDMDVEITSGTNAPFPIFATVWVVKTQGGEVLGPFTVFAGNLLSVSIDNDQWGVVISCNWNINASVWIE